MSMTDPIADMLTRIRNALMAGKEKVDVPASALKEGIARILRDEGYIINYRMIEDTKQGVIRITLKYADPDAPAIENLQRVSKPGRREGGSKGSQRPWDRDPFDIQGNSHRPGIQSAECRWRGPLLYMVINEHSLRVCRQV